jgi:dipeptide/tripeptide permease
MAIASGKEKIRFPKVFWVANSVELLERAAYYAFWISVTLYLTNIVGFDDIWAGWIGGVFGAGLYFLPPFTGAYADKIGFRKAVILAFSCLSIGYLALGLFPIKMVVIPALIVVLFGGSFIKSIITGTVAKCSSEKTRAKAYSLFYLIVNIGAFAGKTFAYTQRVQHCLE